MGSFETLDYEGQLARLTDTAFAALRAYGLDDAQIQPILYVNNATFRVELPSGERYALRVNRPGPKRADWIQSELEWLRDIHRQTHLHTTVPVPLPDGSLLTEVALEGVDKPVTCTLFEWIDGQTLQWEQIDLQKIRATGIFLGQLHEFSTGYQPPAHFVRPTLDWEGLFGENSPYNPGAGAAIFTADQRAVFTQVDTHVGAVMDELGQGSDNFGLIHADFIAKNFLFRGDDLYAIDFDDCGWGYYLYDLAPLLTQTRGEPNFAAIYDAFWEGYTGVRHLPDADRAYLETFIAARHLASCRWLAGNLHNPRIRERAAEIIAYRTAELRHFLETGAISHPGEQF